MELVIGVSWFFLLGALVWLALQACDVARDRYLMPQRKPWPGTPSPWRWDNWPSVDRVLLALAAFLGALSVTGPSAAAPAAPAAYLLAGIVCLRLAHRARAWWTS